MTQDSHDEKRRKHMAVMDDKRKNKMTSSETTFNDEELIKHLRAGPEIVYRYVSVDHAAADRIQELILDVAGWISNAQAALDYLSEAEYKLEVAEAKLAECEARLSKAMDVLSEILFFSKEDDVGGWLDADDVGGWLDAIARGYVVMAELEKAKGYE